MARHQRRRIDNIDRGSCPNGRCSHALSTHIGKTCIVCERQMLGGMIGPFACVGEEPPARERLVPAPKT